MSRKTGTKNTLKDLPKTWAGTGDIIMNEIRFIYLKKNLQNTVNEMRHILREIENEKEFNEILRFKAIDNYHRFMKLYNEINKSHAEGTMLYNLNMLQSNVNYAWETWGLELRKYV